MNPDMIGSMPRRTIAVLLGLVLFAALNFAPQRAEAAAVMTITEYPYLTPGGFGSHLTVGPDGNAYVGLREANKVAKVTPEGVVTEFLVPTSDAYPSYLTPGPDGNIWIAEGTGGRIAKMTPAGVFTEYPIPNGNNPTDLTFGPDGNVWFTEGEAGKIGRMAPDGSGFVEFTPPSGVVSNPSGIDVGPDGNLWVVLREANRIAKVTTAGAITEYTIPTANSDTDGIRLGPDGNMWFAESDANKIGRITPGGVITEFPIPTPSTQTGHVAPGPDGNLWFAEDDAGKIGRITPAGVITEYPLPTPISGPHYVEMGPDGNLWVTERDANKVAKVQIPLNLTVTLEGAPQGTVTSDPAGIDCGTDCTDTYLSGTVVTLTATPPVDTSFQWGGHCAGTAVGCDVAMTGDKEVAAIFGTTFTLTVTRRGKGKVTSTPAGIICGTDCTQDYAAGTEVTLTKKPKRGWKFVRWTGDCTGKKACVLTMDSDKAVKAKFKRKT